ncbi:MAG: hypothetical protein LBC35_00950, partial [Coriobacteriales bacterium]|nr:hypothetical protein [Coriobacteriales bacterium]
MRHQSATSAKPSVSFESLRVLLMFLLAAALILSLSPLLQAHAAPTSAQVQAQADEASAKLAAMEAEMEQFWADYTAAVNAHDSALESMNEA